MRPFFTIALLALVAAPAAYAQPANDPLASATVLSPAALPLAVTGTTLGATSEPGEALSTCGETGENSVWWSFTPATSGSYRISTAGSDFDTILSLWTGSGHPLAEVACNDDAGSTVQSTVVQTLDAGTPYFVRVVGYANDEGAVALSVEAVVPPANDNLADAPALTLGTAAMGTNLGASAEPNEAVSTCEKSEENSVWWSFTPATSGSYRISTAGSDFDTILSLWTGSGHPLAEVACNDDAGGPGQSEVSEALVAGTPYFVRVVGYSNDAGNIVLRVSPPPAAGGADNRADATPVQGALPLAFAGSTVGATREPGEAFASCEPPDQVRSVWFRYVPTADGTLSVDVNPTSGLPRFSVTVYDGSTELGASCDPGGRVGREAELRATPGKDGPRAFGAQGIAASTSVPVTSGTTYDIRVSAVDQFSFEAAFDGPTALPVELVAFEAVAAGRTARLSWTTASETNNAGFAVEQKVGETWAERGFVSGHGTTTERHDYAFQTGDLPFGRHSFRLRQGDLDGSVHYSAVVEVFLGVTELRVGRTPSGLYLWVPEEQTADVYDLSGRRVRLGLTTGRLDTDGMAAGMYFVRTPGKTVPVPVLR